MQSARFAGRALQDEARRSALLSSPAMRTLRATRYVTPLREGGSLPAIVEAEDDGLYVLKFRAAGHGLKALIAELLCGELARVAGLNVPELVQLDVDAALGRNEPDPEIRDLLRASTGLNLGLDYLPGSLSFDPAVGPSPSSGEASAIVWWDAWITNVDRTAKNPNLLWWHRRLWLIDHGSALYFHHAWADAGRQVGSPFEAIVQHVVLPWADDVPGAGDRLARLLTPAAVRDVLEQVPDDWLAGEPGFASPAEHRDAYARHLQQRLARREVFEQEAARARASLV